MAPPSRSSTRVRRGTKSAAACAKAAACSGQGASILAKEASYAMGGVSDVKVKATCPEYTGIIVFLIVIYGFFLSLLYATRPGFVLKANAAVTDANSPDILVSLLYSLLFTAIVLIVIAMIVRCARCA